VSLVGSLSSSIKTALNKKHENQINNERLTERVPMKNSLAIHSYKHTENSREKSVYRKNLDLMKEFSKPKEKR
jgi:hypothetical protein